MTNQWELVLVQTTVAMIMSKKDMYAGLWKQGRLCVRELAMHTRTILQQLQHSRVDMTSSLEWLLQDDQLSIVHKSLCDGISTEALEHQLRMFSHV